MKIKKIAYRIIIQYILITIFVISLGNIDYYLIAKLEEPALTIPFTNYVTYDGGTCGGIGPGYEVIYHKQMRGNGTYIVGPQINYLPIFNIPYLSNKHRISIRSYINYEENYYEDHFIQNIELMDKYVILKSMDKETSIISIAYLILIIIAINSLIYIIRIMNKKKSSSKS